MPSTKLTAETLIEVRESLKYVVPEEDLLLPGGERQASASYVHVHLPIMAAAANGYGYEDSAFGLEGDAIAKLSSHDRKRWIGECHRATAKGARWIRPHLSQMTQEYLEQDPEASGSFVEHAIDLMPPPLVVQRQDDLDEALYGVVTRLQGNDYLVPMYGLARGEVGSARRIAGLGAGLQNAANWNEALVGEPDRGVNGNWLMRPLTNATGGPVMIIGIEWQGEATAQERELARNAAERHILIHDAAPETQTVVSIPYTTPIMPYEPGVDW